MTENVGKHVCLLTNGHESHLWWYTSSGGGHMLDDPLTAWDIEYEKNLKQWWCPGVAAQPEPYRSSGGEWSSPNNSRTPLEKARDLVKGIRRLPGDDFGRDADLIALDDEITRLTALVETNREQAREAVEMYQEERGKVQAIRDAWVRPGVRPDVHLQAQMHLQKNWPTLATALRKLV